MSFHRKCERCNRMSWVHLKRQALCNECKKVTHAMHSPDAIKRLIRSELQFNKQHCGHLLEEKMRQLIANETAMPWERTK